MGKLTKKIEWTAKRWSWRCLRVCLSKEEKFEWFVKESRCLKCGRLWQEQKEDDDNNEEWCWPDVDDQMIECMWSCMYVCVCAMCVYDDWKSTQKRDESVAVADVERQDASDQRVWAASSACDHRERCCRYLMSVSFWTVRMRVCVCVLVVVVRIGEMRGDDGCNNGDRVRDNKKEK